MTALQVPLDQVDLDALDEFLNSDAAPLFCMALSELDGFLTGIAVGPEIVMPSEWLPLAWGDEHLTFDDFEQAQKMLGRIMGHFNNIIRNVQRSSLNPLFQVDRDGAIIPFEWAEGFKQAILLRMEAWKPLFLSEQDNSVLVPILGLCSGMGIQSVLELTVEEENELFERAPQVIPGCVNAIAAFWNSRRRKQPMEEDIFMRIGTSPKVGRNELCPCGSAKKFKKCCGKSDRATWTNAA